MARKKAKLVSAQVTLRAASGKSFDAQTAITTENIGDYLPSPDTIKAAQKAFAEAGFDVGNVVGVSFSITDPASTFERVFKVKLRSGDRGGIKVMSADGRNLGQELPVEALPRELKQHVVAATFSTPPDFGPTDY